MKTIAGHALTPGKTVGDHIHVAGTKLQVPCGQLGLYSREEIEADKYE